MAMERQSALRRGAEPLQLVVEDHGVVAAVRVHERDRAPGGRERGLDDRHHGRDAAPACERDDRRVGFPQHEQPGRAHHFDGVAGRDRVVHPVRHAATRHALDGRRQRVPDVGRARHRVAADHLLAADRGAERAELPGRVRERGRERGRDVEDERAGVRRLVDDGDDRKCVVGVVGQQHLRFPVGDAAMIMASPFSANALSARASVGPW